MWWDAFSWIGFKFSFQKSFSSCCELFPNLKAASVIPYLFLFSYKTSKKPPKAQSRMLQVEKLKTSHSFLAILWLTIVTAVKEQWRKIFTHQPLPVYSIETIFFITLFLPCKFIYCTRQEPEQGERAVVSSSPWRSCAQGPHLRHPAHCGAGATAEQSSRRWFSSSANTERFSALAHHLSSVPSILGGWKQSSAGRGAGNGLLEGELNTKVCHCPAGTGELAGKLDMIHSLS